MNKLILKIPAVFGVAGTLGLVAAPPVADGATVTLSVTGNSCTYTSIATNATGDLVVTCSGSPAPTETPPPGPTPTPPPIPTAAPPGCKPQTGTLKYINDLRSPSNNTAFSSGQDYYDRPVALVADGTIGSSQVLVVPFIYTGNSTATRVGLLPGGYGGVSSFSAAISTCPGSLDPAEFATPNLQQCARPADSYVTIYFSPGFCPLVKGQQYYLNAKPIRPEESTTSFLLGFS